MESPSSLGSQSTMYQGREGGFEFSYKRPPKDKQYDNALLCLQEFPKKYQQCVIWGRDRGDSVVGHPTTLVHHSRERETLRPGSSEVKTSLHRDLEPLVLRAPWQVGKIFIFISYQNSIRGEVSVVV